MTNLEFSYSGALADAVYSKKLMKAPLPKGWVQSDMENKYDPYNKYTLNSYNYRGPEPTENVDFIFAGCSQTFGIGVPDDGVWPKFLAESLGGTYVNLSMLGASTEWIVDSIYRYIETFGKPNRGIVVLAPDHRRLDSIIDNQINSCNYHRGPNDYMPIYLDDNRDIRFITFHFNRDSDRPNFLKKPFPVEDLVTEHESLRRYVKAFNNLEIFCKHSNIPLIWSSWSEEFNMIVRSIPSEYKFKDFIDVTYHNLYKYSKDTNFPDAVKCHEELSSSYGLAFDEGTDRFKNGGKHGHHMGVHSHIHVASDFFNRANEIGM